MKIQLIAIVVLSALSSCQKGNDKPVTRVPAKTFADETLSVSPDSSLMAYDSVGILHNVILDSVWNYVQKSKDTSSEGKKNYIIQYFQKYEAKGVAAKVRQELDNADSGKPHTYQKILQSSNFETGTKQLLQHLFEVINDTQNMDAYPSLIKEISLIADTALIVPVPANERNDILQVVSVAQHSASFWKYKIENNPLPGNGNAQPAKSFLRFLASMNADTLGALYGIFTGDMAGESAYQSSLWAWYVDAYM